jgi:hypothetical protein
MTTASWVLVVAIPVGVWVLGTLAMRWWGR